MANTLLEGIVGDTWPGDDQGDGTIYGVITAGGVESDDVVIVLSASNTNVVVIGEGVNKCCEWSVISVGSTFSFPNLNENNKYRITAFYKGSGYEGYNYKIYEHLTPEV